MMGTHFSAIKNMFPTHTFLDEGMTALAADRIAPFTGNDVLCIPDQARVKEDLGTGMLLEEVRGKKTDKIIPFDEASIFIKEEAAVKIPVPGNAKIGPFPADSVAGGSTVLNKGRIRNSIGEMSVRRVIKIRKVTGHVFGQFLYNGTGSAISGVSHDV